MAFPTGWGRKCAVVIDADEVDAALTDFPVLCSEDNLPSEMFDADGSNPALNGGGDIRFSSDSAGSTQLACEVVSFVTDNDPANGTAQIWVKVPSLSASVDTTIYVWYEKTGESQPSASDTYGSQNVWDSNFVLVAHLEEDPSGTSPQMLDSTSNANHLTTSGSMGSGQSITGIAGNQLDLDGTDDWAETGSNIGITGAAARTTEFVCTNRDSYSLLPALHFGNNSGTGAQYVVNPPPSYGLYGWFADYAPGGGGSFDTQYALAQTYDGTSVRLYVDGVQHGSTTTLALNTAATTLKLSNLGQSPWDQYPELDIDELRVSSTNRSTEWLAASRSTLFAPGTFAAAGTPEGAAGSSAALTGTATETIDESDVVTGGKTIIITLTGDTFVAAGTGPIGSTANTQAIIDGISAATSPAGGWNDEWRDKEVTSSVVRTSDTVCTITMSSQATLSGSYDISSQETITVTVPGAALTGASPIVASPTFTVDAVGGLSIPIAMYHYKRLMGVN